MSYQVGSACYDTPAAAAAASASGQVGTLVRHAEVAYVVNASSVEDASITYSLTPLGGGNALVVVAPYTAQPCGLLTTGDAVQLSWLVVGVWAAVFAVKFIATAVQGWGDQHGHA